MQMNRTIGGSCDLVIIDDADRLLKYTGPGSSGPWVRFIEELRRHCAKLVLLSSVPVSALTCDEHALSRLRAGLQLLLGRPADSELLDLLQSLARQRGIALNTYKSEYLLRRLGADIPALEKYLNRLRLQVDYLGAPLGFKEVSRLLGE